MKASAVVMVTVGITSYKYVSNIFPEKNINKEGIRFLESNVTLLKQKRGELEVLTKRFQANEEMMKEHEKQIAEYEKEYKIWHKKYKDFEKLKTDKGKTYILPLQFPRNPLNFPSTPLQFP